MKKTIILATVVVLCAILAARADVLVLKNGNSLRGRIVRVDDEEVTIEVPDGRIRVSRSKIKKIVHEKDSTYYVRQGDEYFRNKSYENALELYLKAYDDKSSPLSLKYKIEETYASLIRKALKYKALDEAEEWHSELTEFNPDSVAAVMEMTEIKNMKIEAERVEKESSRLLSEGKYDEAIAYLKKTLKEAPLRSKQYFPKLAEAYIRSAAENYRKSDFKAAAGRYDLAIQYNPEAAMRVERPWAFSKIAVAKDMIQSGDTASARKTIEDVLEVLPGNPIAFFFMGDSYLKEKRPGDAAECYRKALPPGKAPGDINELREAARLAVNELAKKPDPLGIDEKLKGATLDEWAEKKTEHFVITHRNNEAAERVARFAEHYAKTILNYFDFEEKHSAWDDKCTIELYPDRESFKKELPEMEWAGGVAQVKTKGDKLVSHRILLFQDSPDAFTSTLPHEMTHLVFQRIVGYGKRIPLWLNEGVAVWMEPVYRHKNLVNVLALEQKRGRLYPLEELFKMKDYPRKSRRATFYAQSFFLTLCLMRKGGNSRITRLARALADGGDVKSTVGIMYGFSDVASLRKYFDRELEKEVGKWNSSNALPGTSK